VHLILHEREQVLVQHARLFAVGDALEAPKDVVELRRRQVKPELAQARAQGVAPAVLAQDHAHVAVRAREADGLGRHDLVRLARLEHAVLVDAALVRKGVGADDGLVRLHEHAAVVRDHAARGPDVNGAHPCPQAPHLPLPAQGDRHDDLLEAGVARALADAVDRALDLPRAGHRARQAVGRGQAQVVLAVGGQHHGVGARGVAADGGDQAAELVRQVPPGGVGDV